MRAVSRPLPLVALAVLLPACNPSFRGGPPDDVHLTVEPPTAVATDSTTLVLANASGETVGYNLCSSALEHRSGGTWAPVPSERVCTMELRTLAPGSEVRTVLGLPTGLPAGEYRYSTTVERMDSGERVVVRSAAFQVGA